MDIGLSAEQLRDAVDVNREEERPDRVLHPTFLVLQRRPHRGQPDRAQGEHDSGGDPFGNYFQNKGKGISCKVSSWHRINSQILPPQAKASGNYLNSVLASLEAKKSGADEAIMLSEGGHVAEGSGREHIPLQGQRPRDALRGIRHTPGHNQGHRDKAGQRRGYGGRGEERCTGRSYTPAARRSSRAPPPR